MAPGSDLTQQLFDFLGKVLPVGYEPQEPRFTEDEVKAKLTEALGAEPAWITTAWFMFTQTWPNVMIAPNANALSLEFALSYRAEAFYDGPVDGPPLLVTPDTSDLMPIGSRVDGSLFVVNPATAAGAEKNEPSIVLYDQGEVFFFNHDYGADFGVKARPHCPTLQEWLYELASAHRDGRIAWIDGGFMMTNAKEHGEKYKAYPWPANT